MGVAYIIIIIIIVHASQKGGSGLRKSQVTTAPPLTLRYHIAEDQLGTADPYFGSPDHSNCASASLLPTQVGK